MISRPHDSGSRSTAYVVLVGRRQRFDLAGQVDAISPQDAVARAVEHGLIRATEQHVVALSTRHWQPVAAADCIGSDH